MFTYMSCMYLFPGLVCKALHGSLKVTPKHSSFDETSHASDQWPK